MKHYIRLFMKYMSQSLKSKLEYKSDFLIRIIASFVMQICGLVSIWGIFLNIGEINGWGYWEIVLVYAAMNFSTGFGEVFFEGPWSLNRLYMTGGLDFYITRPVPVLFQLFASAVGVNGIGNMATALALFLYALGKIEYKLSVQAVIVFIVLLFLSLPVKGAIILLSTSTTFWTKAPGNAFANLVHNLADYLKYPITIYPMIIQIFFSVVVPYAFVSFYPVSFLLKKEIYSLVALAGPLVSFGFVFIAINVFNRGIKKYEGVGN